MCIPNPTFQLPAMIGCRSFNWVRDLGPLLLTLENALVPERPVAMNASGSFMVDRLKMEGERD